MLPTASSPASSTSAAPIFFFYVGKKNSAQYIENRHLFFSLLLVYLIANLSA